MFDGKSVLVTGAASGIGRATAAAFAQRGAQLILVDIDGAALEQTALELTSKFGRVRRFVLDVTNHEQFCDLAARLHEEVGAIDVLVNNAGLLVAGGYQSSLVDYDRALAVNLMGAVHAVRLFVPHMQKAQRGAVVNVASASGLVAFATLTAYSVSKFALVGFSSALDAEVRRDGVSVACVCTGLVRSGFAKQLPLNEPERAELNRVLERHGLSPELVAEAIVRAVVRKQFLVLVGGQARILSWLARLAPARASRALAWVARAQRTRGG